MRAPPEAISARMLLRAVEHCRRRGHDVDALLHALGLDPRALADPAARVPYATAARLGERLLEVSRDANFGLHLAQDVQDPSHLDAGLLLLMASPDVRTALARMVSYQRYWGDGERSTLVDVPGGLALRFRLPGSEGAYARHADECAMAEVAIGLRVLSGRGELSPRLVRFRHRAPGDLTEHRATFACPLEFASEHTEAVLDDATLAVPMRQANEAFCSVFSQQIERALARLPPRASTSSHVRDAARAALASGNCTLARTARSLGTSARSLQRRLRDEGTSFVEVVDALRRELSVAYLARAVPIAEVASLLGYSDATAFHHAFRRWTGASPARYAAG